MELVLTLPILALVLFALFEFALLFSARSSVVEAARFGARKASHPLVEPDDVKQAVRRKLSPRLRRAAAVRVEPGRHSGDVVSVSIRVPMSSAAPDLLWPIGYSLKERALHAQTRMVKE